MSLRVVVVEDETLTRIDLIEILKENGYDVVGEAADGIEAVEVCKKLQPDIVLLDIKIPYISGLKVANILKEEGVIVRYTELSYTCFCSSNYHSFRSTMTN